MAKDFDVARELMTVQQVMAAIGARAPSTITRLIKSKRLRATRVGTLGWLVYRDSVDEMLEEERRSGPTVGFPRGETRQQAAPPKRPKAAKPPAAGKPAKKPRRR